MDITDLDDNTRAVFTVTFVCRGTRADIRTALFDSETLVPDVFSKHRVDIDDVLVEMVGP